MSATTARGAAEEVLCPLGHARLGSEDVVVDLGAETVLAAATVATHGRTANAIRATLVQFWTSSEHEVVVLIVI